MKAAKKKMAVDELRMMNTLIEAENRNRFYQNMTRIADALESIVNLLEIREDEKRGGGK